VNIDVYTMKIKGGIKSMGHVRIIYFHERWICCSPFISLILDVFSWVLEHLPILIGSGGVIDFFLLLL